MATMEHGLRWHDGRLFISSGNSFGYKKAILIPHGFESMLTADNKGGRTWPK
jgi:hypothetical protein